MITDGIMTVAIGFVSTVLGWFPQQPAVAQVVVSAGGYLTPIVAGAASLGCWIPWGVIVACMVIVVPLYLGSFGFKILRAVVSYLPLIGGAG